MCETLYTSPPPKQSDILVVLCLFDHIGMFWNVRKQLCILLPVALDFASESNMYGCQYVRTKPLHISSPQSRPLNLGNAVVVCYDVMCDDVILMSLQTMVRDCAKVLLAICSMLRDIRVLQIDGKNVFLPLALAFLRVQILRGTCERIPIQARSKLKLSGGVICSEVLKGGQGWIQTLLI